MTRGVPKIRTRGLFRNLNNIFSRIRTMTKPLARELKPAIEAIGLIQFNYHTVGVSLSKHFFERIRRDSLSF